MKQNEFIALVNDPFKAASGDMEKLQDLKKQFPFFQSAHMLLTLISKKYDSGLYQQTLRQTAISIPNRARLHTLLNAAERSIVEEKIEPVKVVVETKVTEIEHLKAIELSSEKEQTKEEALNALVEKEIQKDVITAFVEKEVLKTNDWYKKPVKKEEEVKEETKSEVKPEIKTEKVELQAGSFSDWLQALKKADRVEPIAEKEQKEEQKPITKKEIKIQDPKDKDDKKAKQQAIIDKIIEVNPANIRLDPNQRFYAADIKAKESLIESEDLVTETLAKIYALQGNTAKAIRAYEILSLKFPQKSAYFATLIQNLKKQNQ